MFSVTIMMLAYAEEEMQAMTGRLNHQIEEIQDILNSLRRLPGLEAVLEELKREQEGLLDGRERLKGMMDALKKIRETYMECERRNLSFREIVSTVKLGGGYGRLHRGQYSGSEIRYGGNQAGNNYDTG